MEVGTPISFRPLGMLMLKPEHNPVKGEVIDFDALWEDRDELGPDLSMDRMFWGPAPGTIPGYTPTSISDTPNLPIESCGACHAEGKQFGIDKVHTQAPPLKPSRN